MANPDPKPTRKKARISVQNHPDFPPDSMLTPQQVIDTYFLESRCVLLEVSAMLDRYEAAVKRCGTEAERREKLICMRRALTVLADPEKKENRTEKLLELFATL
jgi:hypothetical protein